MSADYHAFSMPEEKPDDTVAQSSRATVSNALIAGKKLFDPGPASGHGVLEACTSRGKRSI
jgi:hypothetical protein